VFVGALPPSTADANSASGFPTDIKGVLKVSANGAANLTPDVLRAPGNDVLTLAPQGRYDFVSGNSLATANVTGAVALLLSRGRGMPAEQLERLLADSARVASTGVNACSALAALLNKGTCDSEKSSQPVAAD
jgi:subtilisin family serine protease